MNCHHLPICQLRGSCPWAIYGPRRGISKGGKEPFECCLFLFRGFYFFLVLVCAPGSRVSVKNQTELISDDLSLQNISPPLSFTIILWSATVSITSCQNLLHRHLCWLASASTQVFWEIILFTMTHTLPTLSFWFHKLLLSAFFYLCSISAAMMLGVNKSWHTCLEHPLTTEVSVKNVKRKLFKQITQKQWWVKAWIIVWALREKYKYIKYIQ